MLIYFLSIKRNMVFAISIAVIHKDQNEEQWKAEPEITEGEHKVFVMSTSSYDSRLSRYL